MCVFYLFIVFHTSVDEVAANRANGVKALYSLRSQFLMHFNPHAMDLRL